MINYLPFAVNVRLNTSLVVILATTLLIVSLTVDAKCDVRLSSSGFVLALIAMVKSS